MRPEDLQYFNERAEQEIRQAQTAVHPAAVKAHYLLGGLYLDLVYSSPGAPPRPRNPFQDEPRA